MNVLAVIPARGNSKGIKRKNLIPLGGKPLILWTIEAACASQLVTEVVVCTEDDEIAEVSARAGVKVIREPAHLAEDHIHASAAVFHVLESYKGYKENAPFRITPDIVTMLLPTSPLRTAAHIDAAVDMMQGGAVGVISVVPLGKGFPHLRDVKDGRMALHFLDNPNVQRQDLALLHVLNGAISMTRPALLWEHQTFHVPNARPLVMSRAEGLDIDTYADLELAELYLLSKEQGVRTREAS